jgi:hypothetical protein
LHVLYHQRANVDKSGVPQWFDRHEAALVPEWGIALALGGLRREDGEYQAALQKAANEEPPPL